MGARRPKITGLGTWNAVSRDEDERLALDHRVGNVEVRLVAAARSRMDQRNHAHFRRGELREILRGATDKRPAATREDASLPHGDTVTRAIERLVSWGLLAHGSWKQCLIVPPFAAMVNAKVPSTPCARKPAGRAA
jgi:hypothetical protein